LAPQLEHGISSPHLDGRRNGPNVNLELEGSGS